MNSGQLNNKGNKLPMNISEMFALSSAFIALLGLLGAKQWRDGLKHNRIYERLDAVKDYQEKKISNIKKEFEQIYVHRDIIDLKHDHLKDDIILLKNDISEIKAETKMIPQILAKVNDLQKHYISKENKGG